MKAFANCVQTRTQCTRDTLLHLYYFVLRIAVPQFKLDCTSHTVVNVTCQALNWHCHNWTPMANNTTPPMLWSGSVTVCTIVGRCWHQKFNNCILSLNDNCSFLKGRRMAGFQWEDWQQALLPSEVSEWVYRLSKPALLGYKTPTTHSLGQLLRNSPPNRDVYWSPGIHPYRDQLKLAFMANRNDYKVLMNPECSVLIGAYHTNRKGFMGTQTTTANCQNAHLVVMVVHTIGQAKYHKHQRLTRKIPIIKYCVAEFFNWQCCRWSNSNRQFTNCLSTVPSLGVTLNSRSHPHYTPLHSILERSDEIRILNKVETICKIPVMVCIHVRIKWHVNAA